MQKRCLVTSVPQKELGLSVLGRACFCYAVLDRVWLCWPLRAPLLFRNRILALIPLFTSRFLKETNKKEAWNLITLTTIFLVSIGDTYMLLTISIVATEDQAFQTDWLFEMSESLIYYN